MKNSEKLTNGQIRVNGSSNNKRNYVTASLGEPQVDQTHPQECYETLSKRVRFRKRVDEIGISDSAGFRSGQIEVK